MDLADLLKVADRCTKRYGGRIPEATYDELRQAARFAAWDWQRRYPYRADRHWRAGLLARVRGAILDELRERDWLSRAERQHGLDIEMVSIQTYHEDKAQACDGPQRRAEARLTLQALGSIDPSYLTEREQWVLQGYLQQRTGAEMARASGLTEGRISQIRKEAIRKLQQLLARRPETRKKNYNCCCTCLEIE